MEILKGKELGHRKSIPVDGSNIELAKAESEELINFMDENNGKFEGAYADGFALHACQVNDSESPYNYFVIADYIHIDSRPEDKLAVGDTVCFKDDKEKKDVRKVLNIDDKLIRITGGSGAIESEDVEVDKLVLVERHFTTENYYFESRVIFNPSIYHALETKIEKKIRVQEKSGKVLDEDHKVAVSNMFYPDEACMSYPDRKEKKVERFDEIVVEYDILEKGKLVHKKETIRGLKSHIFQHECDHAIGYDIYWGFGKDEFGEKKYLTIEDRMREDGKTMSEVAKELEAKGELNNEEETGTQEVEEEKPEKEEAN